jgi:hypothetical protein
MIGLCRFSCICYIARNHKILKGKMGLVDLREERGIMQRLVRRVILRGKYYLEMQTTRYQ